MIWAVQLLREHNRDESDHIDRGLNARQKQQKAGAMRKALIRREVGMAPKTQGG